MLVEFALSFVKMIQFFMGECLNGEQEQIIRWEIDHQTGHPCSQSMLLSDGCTLHNDHFPAYRELDPKTGRTVLERWYNFGEMDRIAVDQPCETRWASNGDAKIGEIHMKMGKVHRDHHRPAKIWYSPYTGSIVREEFWIDNQLHRGNNYPAIVEYDEITGSVTRCEFYLHGERIVLAKYSPSP